MTGFVYFVRSGAAGPIKIGISSNWEGRIAALQTAHHDRLNVMLVIATERAASLERVLHEQFRSFRRVGEWFEPESLLLTFIECLRESGADVRAPRPFTFPAGYEPRAEPPAAPGSRLRRMSCCPKCDQEKTALQAQWPSFEWTQEHSCDGQQRFEATLPSGYRIGVEPHGDVWLEDPRGDEVWRTDCFTSEDHDVTRAVTDALAWVGKRVSP